MDVSAVIVTRGDYDLDPVLESLPFEDIVVWDNSERAISAGVYGRYLGIAEARNDVIYVQDDDCLVRDVLELVSAHRPGHITANMPWDRQGDRITLLGWGAVFHRSLPEHAFRQYLGNYPLDQFFLRTCDVIFAGLTPCVRLNLGHTDLPWATSFDRMHRHPDHYAERDVARSRADRLLRGILPVEQVAQAEG